MFITNVGPPDIISAPVDTIEIDDNDVTLICNALAFPQHNITWMYQRMRSDVGRDITSSSDTNMKYLINNTVITISFGSLTGALIFGTLTITNLQYDDRGIYTCVAANTRGVVSASAMINVHGKGLHTNAKKMIWPLYHYILQPFLSCHF